MISDCVVQQNCTKMKANTEASKFVHYDLCIIIDLPNPFKKQQSEIYKSLKFNYGRLLKIYDNADFLFWERSLLKASKNNFWRNNKG